jgi:hypothetical protein
MDKCRFPVGVCFRALDQQLHATYRPCEVGHVESDQLRAAHGASETDEGYCPVKCAGKVGPVLPQELPDLCRGQRGGQAGSRLRPERRRGVGRVLIDLGFVERQCRPGRRRSGAVQTGGLALAGFGEMVDQGPS